MMSAEVAMTRLLSTLWVSPASKTMSGLELGDFAAADFFADDDFDAVDAVADAVADAIAVVFDADCRDAIFCVSTIC